MNITIEIVVEVDGSITVNGSPVEQVGAIDLTQGKENSK